MLSYKYDESSRTIYADLRGDVLIWRNRCVYTYDSTYTTYLFCRIGTML